MAKLNYRSDIDGLRAVAVLLVVLFHLGLGVPGGYIGVDVFFVISGYLITGIIYPEIERGTFSFLAFYGRRARRILPALLVVLVVTSVGAMFILLPSDLERFTKSLVATLLSLSNFWFWSQGGYFGSTSEMAPLLHTWSLAVEEQFYLVLPVVLIFLHRLVPRWTVRVIVFTCIASFAASAWFVNTRTPEVFYFSPFRAWELLLGSLLALCLLPVVVSSRYRQWIAAAGLGLILAPAFMFTAETVFPGPAAALPCIGAALLIWINASGETAVGRLLKNRSLVFVGLISYSLYLWHWPLLVLTKHALGENLGLNIRLAIGLASVLLATASWRLIETPFRSLARTNARQAWGYAGASVALLVAVVAVVLPSQGLPDRFDPKVVAMDRARARDVVRGECIDLRGQLNANTVCRVGASGVPHVLVWGDSYAHAMLPAFDLALRQIGVAAWFASESGCPPLPDTTISFKGRDNWRCREFNTKMIEFLSAQSSINYIVLTAAWDAYVEESSGYVLRGRNAEGSVTAMKESLATLTSQLRASGVVREVIVVGQVPTYGWSVPLKMAANRARGEAINPLTRNEWQKKSAVSRSVFEHLAADRQISFIQSAEWFCGELICRYATAQGEPLYWDHGHVNGAGVRFIAPMLERELRPLVKSSMTAPVERIGGSSKTVDPSQTQMLSASAGINKLLN